MLNNTNIDEDAKSSTWSETSDDKAYFQRRRELYSNNLNNIAWTGFDNTRQKLCLVPHRLPSMPSIDPEEVDRIIHSDDAEFDSDLGNINIEHVHNKNQEEQICSLEPSDRSFCESQLDSKLEQNTKTRDENKNDKIVSELRVQNENINYDTKSNSIKENVMNSPNESTLLEDKDEDRFSYKKYNPDFTWGDLELDSSLPSILNTSSPRVVQQSCRNDNNLTSSITQEISNRKSLKFNYKYNDENVFEVKEDIKDLIDKFLNDSLVQEKLQQFLYEYKLKKEVRDTYKQEIEKRMEKSFNKSTELNNYLTDISKQLNEIKTIITSESNVRETSILSKLQHIETLLREKLNSSSSSEVGSKNVSKDSKDTSGHTSLMYEICSELKWLSVNNANFDSVKPIQEMCNSLNETNQDELIIKRKTQTRFDISLPHYSVYPVDIKNTLAEDIEDKSREQVQEKEPQNQRDIIQQEEWKISKSENDAQTASTQMTQQSFDMVKALNIPPLNLPSEEDSYLSCADNLNLNKDERTNRTENFALASDTNNVIEINIENTLSYCQDKPHSCETSQQIMSSGDRIINKKKQKSNKKYKNISHRYDWLESEKDLELSKNILDTANMLTHRINKNIDLLPKHDKYSVNVNPTKSSHAMLQWLNQSSSEIDSLAQAGKIKGKKTPRKIHQEYKNIKNELEEKLHSMFTCK